MNMYLKIVHMLTLKWPTVDLYLSVVVESDP